MDVPAECVRGIEVIPDEDTMHAYLLVATTEIQHQQHQQQEHQVQVKWEVLPCTTFIMWPNIVVHKYGIIPATQDKAMPFTIKHIQKLDQAFLTPKLIQACHSITSTLNQPPLGRTGHDDAFNLGVVTQEFMGLGLEWHMKTSGHCAGHSVTDSRVN